MMDDMEYSLLGDHPGSLHIDVEKEPIGGDTLEDSPLIGANIFFRDHNQGEQDLHCHGFISSNEDKKALKKLILASSFCFLCMGAEVVGGYLAGSLAIMTDAAHLFSDFIGFLISIMAILLSRKSANIKMTYGYYRSEVLGAFLSIMTIWFLAAVFLVLALRRLYKEEYHIDADAMIIVASIGLVVNIIMGGLLHGVCHTHSHGNPMGHGSDNINVRAAAAHVLGDLLQSFGVLVAAVIVKLFPDAQSADPICTLIFSVIIIFTTAAVGRDSIWILMQGSPINRDHLAEELRKISGVKHVHDVNIWSLAPGRNVVTAHLAVEDYCDKDIVIQTATTAVKNKMSIYSCTIQVETYNVEGISNCNYCKIREC